MNKLYNGTLEVTPFIETEEFDNPFFLFILGELFEEVLEGV